MAVTTGVTNIGEVNAAFKKFVTLYEGDIGKALRSVAIKAFSRLQINTPRDTGRAINGWNVTIDRRPSEWKPPANKSHYVALTFPGMKINYNSFINISNNVEYRIPLEEGHSMQKPTGFIQQSFRDTYANLAAEIALLDRRNYGL